MGAGRRVGLGEPRRVDPGVLRRFRSVSFEDGKRIIDSVGQEPRYPSSWDYAIRWTQETADILAEGGWFSEIDAEDLFDRRFETVAYESVPEIYRVGADS